MSDVLRLRRTRWSGVWPALCALMLGCASASGLRAPADDTAEGLRVRFQKAVIEFRANQRPGGAPDAPGLIRLASQMLAANAVAHTFTGNPGDLTLTLEPSLDTGLNRLALQVRDTVKGTAVYDLRRYLKDPDANADFDPTTGVLSLPHTALLELNADEPTVRHELVHVRTFGTLRSGWLAPFQGYLKASQFGERELFLDEINAYAEDVRFAAHQLSEILRRDPDPAGRIARSNFAEIFRARISGQKPDGQLSFLEQVWDRLVARTIYGGSLALPASEVLLPLERAAADPAQVKYVPGPEGAMAEVQAQRATADGGTETVTGRFHLPSSTGVDDPKNAQILLKQITTSQDAAQQHADQLGRAKAMFHAIVGEVSPARKAELLLNAKAVAGEP